jgi:hypothetical protein
VKYRKRQHSAQAAVGQTRPEAAQAAVGLTCKEASQAALGKTRPETGQTPLLATQARYVQRQQMLQQNRHVKETAHSTQSIEGRRPAVVSSPAVAVVCKCLQMHMTYSILSFKLRNHSV